jgi:hypothetical protein
MKVLCRGGGIHKGDSMINVPAGYLLHLYEENKCSGAVKDYIVDNLDFIKKGA